MKGVESADRRAGNGDASAKQDKHQMREVNLSDIIDIVGEVLGDKQLTAGFDEQSRLLGAIPELDSMAAVNLMLALEQRYGFLVLDDEVEVEIFDTVGSLREFAQRKLRATQL